MTTALSNYVADNRRMPAPPAYFLQRIADYDSWLVILPSRTRPGAYVIARRKQFGPGITEAAIDAIYANPDTKMCVMNGCVPVCMMFATGNSWDPEPILAKLAARDIWAHGGADAFADKLEAQEAAEKAATRKAIRDDLYNRSGAAWRSYQARTGQSSNLFHNRPSPGTLPTAASGAPIQAPDSRSTAGLGKPSD